MKSRFNYMIICIIFTAMIAATAMAEKAPEKIYTLASTILKAHGLDPVIVKAVKAENQKNRTLQQINEMDQKWLNTPGIADYMKGMMESDCARHLESIQKSAEYYAEIFVMDNQGANVAMTDKTSDYWQGDEDKFIKSFKSGAGELFVDEVEFDDSTQAYLVQVSVPVMDGDKAIGAITFGIDMDKVK